MSSRSNLTHLVTAWHVWVANELDVPVPAFCGVTQRHWDVNSPATGHEIYGSAPSKMCPDCLSISEIALRAISERQAEADRVLVNASSNVREAL